MIFTAIKWLEGQLGASRVGWRWVVGGNWGVLGPHLNPAQGWKEPQREERWWQLERKDHDSWVCRKKVVGTPRES